MACCNWGVDLPGWGNALSWDDEGNARPEYEVRAEPTVGAIGVRNGGNFGHVAFVTNVADDGGVTVSEMNCLPCTPQNTYCCSNPDNHNLSVRVQKYRTGRFNSFIYPPLIRAQGHFVSNKGTDYGNDQVFFVQNRTYYHILSAEILGKMKSTPRWGSVIDRPASIFKQTIQQNGFTEGPQFLKLGPESEGLLLRKIGKPEVYTISGNLLQNLSNEKCVEINCWPNVIDVPEVVFNQYLGLHPPQNLKIIAQ